MRRPRLCPAPGCPHLITASNPCPTHPPRDRRSPSSRVTGHSRFRPIRRRILARDGNVCHWCGGPATQADHVIPVSRGGSDDDSNLVASCATCNNRRNAR